jgi:hypothetical protein
MNTTTTFETDIQNIENEILTEHPPDVAVSKAETSNTTVTIQDNTSNDTNDTNIPIPKPPDFKPRKQQYVPKTKIGLVRRIKQLCQKLNEPVPTDLDNMSTDDLSRITSALMDRSVNLLQGIPQETSQIKNITDRMAVQSLYRTTALCCTGVELLSMHYKDNIGGVSLQGYGQDIVANKEDLETLLLEIWNDNKSTLTRYLSPITALFMTLLTIGANRYSMNTEALKKNSSSTLNSPGRPC